MEHPMNDAQTPTSVADTPVTRLVLADDHRMVLSALRHLLGVRKDLQVEAEAMDATQLLSLPALAWADVLLLDLNLPGTQPHVRSAELPGLRLLPQLRQLTPARIVILSMHDESAVVLRALHLGASGFVTKSSPGDRLFEAIDTVLQGRSYVDPAILGVTAAAAPQGPPMPLPTPVSGTLALSRQEREVGQLLLVGMTQKAISHRLNISPQTTHTYKRRLREKLGAASDADLLRKLEAAVGHAAPS